jgi:excisionase family DNA binding protein
MTTPTRLDDSLLMPAEVAEMFRVDAKTVTRWAVAGKLTAVRTLGGHRRYRADEVLDLLRTGTEPAWAARSSADRR